MEIIAKLIQQLCLRLDVVYETIAADIEATWAKLLAKHRDYIFLGATAASSLIALTSLARDTSYSNFFIYALLLVVFVFANRSRFEEVATPDVTGIALGLVLVVGSFSFNHITALYTGDSYFGLTDYVILTTGVFALFYSIKDSLTRLGVAILTLLRGSTLLLGIAYPWIYIGVSSFFVSIVLSASNTLVSSQIYPGPEPGTLIVGGAAGGQTVGIGWACAGLEELMLVSVLLYVLIFSLRLKPLDRLIWLSLGVAGSFVVNIARMVTLIWVAFNSGIEQMRWVHTHLGDILFLVWIAVFWVMFFKVEERRRHFASSSDEQGG